jgi:predicted transglutaminase-like cysteine proteinase
MLRVCTVMAALLLGACSAVPERGTVLQSLDAAPQPFGSAADCAAAQQMQGGAAQAFWDDFCHPAAAREAAVVTLTPERYRELEDVQHDVNAKIAYASTVSWNPLAGAGDCKTFVARKALELLERGWPAGALRIATAFVNDHSPQQLEYHAVLLVDTDRGTLVLDSRQRAPRPWRQVSYIWMTAQARGASAGKTSGWTRLPADPTQVEMALAAASAAGGPGASAQ